MPARLTPPLAFLALAGLFGLYFSVLMPPFQVPDETFHVLRAYQISTGHPSEFAPDGRRGAWVPSSLIEFFSAFQKVPLKPWVKVSAEEILHFRSRPLEAKTVSFIPYATALPHPAFPYLPQSLGIGLARALGLSPFYLLYFGRLFNLVVWLALVGLAIRRTAVFPWLLFLLALTPMSLQQAASLSPDAMTNGLAFLLFASWTRLALDPGEESKPGSVLVAMALSLLLTLSKFAYGLHALLFFLIPWKKFGSRAKYALGMGLMMSLSLAWMLTSLHSGAGTGQAGSGSRVLDMVGDPLPWLKVFGHTLRVYGPYYLEQFIGRLGHLDTALPKTLVVYEWLLLLGVACCETSVAKSLPRRAKLWIAAILAAEFCAIWIGLYLTWTSPGASLIRGGQGRYLIPMAPFFFLLLYRSFMDSTQPRQKWLAPLCLYSAVMSSVVAAFFLYGRFYG